MEGWYVAKTKARKEAWALRNLEQWGIEVFAPQILRPDGRGRRWEPLFPGYIFCQFDPESPLAPIVRWSPGVSYLLGTSDGPNRVPYDVIRYLDDRVTWWNEGGYQTPFQSGERVVVQQGPMMGLEGIFQRYLHGRQRCEVLLEFVGRLGRAEVPETLLRRSIAPHPLWTPSLPKVT